MDRQKLDQYISTSYHQWVNYATKCVRRSKLPIDPPEVVNDVLCSLLSKNTDKLIAMMTRTAGQLTELDLFVMHIIKTSIISPQSPFRYQRGQRVTIRAPRKMKGIGVEDAEMEDQDRRELVRAELSKITTSDLAKRVFVWKFFDGNMISRWPGSENKRLLYRLYGRVYKNISRKVRKMGV